MLHLSSLKSQKSMKTKLLLFIFTSLVLVINSKIETALFDLIFIVLYAYAYSKI